MIFQLFCLDLLDELPPCTLLDIDGSGDDGSGDYSIDTSRTDRQLNLRTDPFQIDIGPSDIVKRGIKKQVRRKRSDKRIPGVTCKLLPPCKQDPNTVDLRGLDIGKESNNKQPGIDCTYDYSIYDYNNEEDYLDFPNEDRSFGGNSQNTFALAQSLDENSNNTREIIPQLLVFDPPPLTTANTLVANVSTEKPFIDVSSSDVLSLPSDVKPADKTHNIVMTCLKMLLSGDEPLEGVNCINIALTEEFDTFNFTTVKPGE